MGQRQNLDIVSESFQKFMGKKQSTDSRNPINPKQNKQTHQNKQNNQAYQNKTIENNNLFFKS